MFKMAKWIWQNNEDKRDEYCEFFVPFITTTHCGTFRISCDGDYTLWINGRYVSSNQYGDFEHYKIYDEMDVSEYLKKGENYIFILVWHFGESTQRYIKSQAGVIFELIQNGNVSVASGEETLVRQNSAYLNNYGKVITKQLGFSFLYDARKENCGEYKAAVLVNKKCDFFRRPTERLRLLSKKQATIVKNDGNYYLVDLGEETVGLPTLEFTSKTEQKILIAWGEDLQNGHVRRIISKRDFSFEYIAKKGDNAYTNYMLRIGCRFLELYAEDKIELKYLGVIPQVYPVEKLPYKSINDIDERIYDVCVKTLELSMMEHYVDTPWREQCLYAFDSRNQMLCGYYAFKNGNARYARANLLLMSKDRREDGLLSITYPCGMDLTIPSFSLYYFMAVREYIAHTKDNSLGVEVYDKLESIIKAFIKNRKGGLMYTFEGVSHWNFYDWSEYLEGKLLEEDTAHADLIINCLFIIALENLKVIADRVGKAFKYEKLIEETRENARKIFYNKERNAYSLTERGTDFTVLGNSLAVISGVATNAKSVCEDIANSKFTECSLSMKCFKYDALILTDRDKWKEWVISEIRRDYKKMLDAGATSVWETIDGASAFDYAGSLCHGWSAMPIYYYGILNN